MRKRIPRFEVILVPAEEGAIIGFKEFKGGVDKSDPYRREYGKRHQIGGEPYWLQKDETPSCPKCGRAMTFVAQIDSLNDSVMFKDMGMLYVFYCFLCHEAKAFSQRMVYRLPCFRVLLEPIDEEGRRLLERRGKTEVDEKDPLKRRFYERHQIGGKPYWIVKEEETPICSRCGQVMTFLAQFDSLSPEISFGKNGVVYVFYCYDCFEGKVITQCY